jgi:D-3-phosphoglycerate dehydrogenase
LALLLAVQRRLPQADQYVRTGWHGSPDLGGVQPIDEATVGVIGCGRIGRAFVGRILPLVNQVLVYDPDISETPVGTVRVGELDELLHRSDVISLHLPLSPDTRGLIGRRELESLPSGAIVINVSPTSALLEAPNTVLTPHCAAVSDRATRRLSRWTIGDALEFLESGSVSHGVVVIGGRTYPTVVDSLAVGQS